MGSYSHSPIDTTTSDGIAEAIVSFIDAVYCMNCIDHIPAADDLIEYDIEVDPNAPSEILVTNDDTGKKFRITIVEE